jgi:hypothetical protein
MYVVDTNDLNRKICVIGDVSAACKGKDVQRAMCLLLSGNSDVL